MTSENNIAQADEAISLLYLITSALRDEQKMPEVDACRLAQNLCAHIGKLHNGRYVYVGNTLCRERVRELIRSEFNGRNHLELAKKYGIGRATVYRYVNSAG